MHERRVPFDTFANRLMLARAHAGYITIREAALRTGLGRGAWQKWERGTPPQNMAEVVTIIARELDVDRDWLMWGGPLGSPGDPPSPDTRPTVGSVTDLLRSVNFLPHASVKSGTVRQVGEVKIPA